MKIQKIETFATEAVTLVRLTTEDGLTGFGQTAPFNADITATVLHRQIAPVALGRDADDLAGLSIAVIDHNHKFPWSYVCRALAGVDTALWDIRGKRQGKTVCELLGGKPRPFRVYGSSMRRDLTAEQEALRLKSLCDSHGFDAFKVRVGTSCGHDRDAWPGRSEELIPAVRRAIGPDAALMIDGNSCYSPRRAIQIGRLLEENQGAHFEEPCPYWELEWTAEVAASLDVPVAGGEQDNDLAQWQRMIAMDAVDIVQPNLCYMGGLTRTVQVAQKAAAAGKLCIPHSANHSFVTVFALHLLGALENAGPYVEFSIEQQTWAQSLFQPVLEAVDGCVRIPDSEPGWGVRVREDWLDKAEYVCSEIGA